MKNGLRRGLCLGILLFCLWNTGARAAEQAAPLSVLLDGRRLALRFEPRTADGVTMVALGDFAAALRAQYGCGSREGQVCLRYGRHTLRLRPGSAVLWADGREIPLPAPPFSENGRLWAPLRPVAEACGMGVLFDQENADIYLTTGIGEAYTLPRGKKIPILMYHGVSDETRGLKELFVKPEEMDKQLAFLQENSYETITFEDFPRLTEVERPVMLTFDDGYADNYTELYPLLQKYGAKATIFMVSGYVDGAKSLSAAQMREMAASGLVSFQSHTHSHPSLPSLKNGALEREMALSRLLLTRITGREPFVIAYPAGESDETVRAMAAAYYRYGLLSRGGVHNTDVDAYKIRRLYVARSTSLSSFKSMMA